MPRRENFSEKSDFAFSSRNLTWEGVELKEDAPERKGFRDRANFHLGAIEPTNTRERERERERERHAEKHQTDQYKNIKK